MSRWILMLAAGCDILGGTKPDGGSQTGDSAGTTPNNTTSGTTPTEVEGQVDCDPLTATPDPGSLGLGDCVTDELTCGGTVTGTIAGGSTAFSNQKDAAFEQCSGHGTGDDLDGPERVYRLDIPEGTLGVSAHLASCENTQFLWYQSTEACPTGHVSCSYVHANGGLDQTEDFIVLSNAGVIWFVVEGLAGTEGNYSLTVECFQ